jgi:hypothetical protein
MSDVSAATYSDARVRHGAGDFLGCPNEQQTMHNRRPKMPEWHKEQIKRRAVVVQASIWRFLDDPTDAPDKAT